MMFHVFAVVTLMVAVFLVYYLRNVPDGGACPRCGSMLTRRPATGGARSLLAYWTDAAECAGCDWRGRMRRTPEPERARPAGGLEP